VTLVDAGTPWSSLAVADDPVVLHDPLCPLTPPEFLAACVAASVDGAVVVGVRPVTDTVKTVADGYVGSTLDREGLLQVVSPVVLPPVVVAALDGLPTTDLAALVTGLAETYPVTPIEAPVTARRVAGEDDLRLLEALTAAAPDPRRPRT
jgi:2-C-methyl-D-erythritol 4-phosphate cytidylyltransferase